MNIIIKNKKVLKPKTKEVTNIIIPNGVTAICDNAFLGCRKLENVILSSTVKDIGKSAFADCPMLKCICFHMEDQTESIGQDAFKRCSSLKYLKIPRMVDRINNIGLITKKYIILSNNINSIEGVISAPAIYFEGTEEEWQHVVGKEYVQGKVYFYSKTIPNTSGKYWRYVHHTPVVYNYYQKEV